MCVVGRWLGGLLIVAGLLALARDLWVWLVGGGAGFSVASAGKLWFDLHRDSLQLLEPALVRHVWEPLWDPVAITILQWPAVAVLAVPGAVLVVACWIFGSRRR